MFTGSSNFRELGGLPAADGRRVRHGLIYRAGHLAHLSSDDLAGLHALQVKLVCDLRSHKERERLPSRLPDGQTPEILTLSVNEDAAALSRSFVDRLRADPTSAGVRAAILAVYRGQPRAFHGKLSVLVDRILAGPGVPLIIHCHAGKDRTGFVCAMLLHALGAPRQSIFENYLASLFDVQQGAIDMAKLLKLDTGVDIDPDALRPLCGVDEAYLAAAFDAAVEQYGSLDGYLQQAAAMTPERTAQLRELLLE
ncbi:MAG: hypothetical protein JWQ90_2412 [Hydrocarboniphaga sp.]|uniref:tyrosine-protein phosphatase n=1 Tax=Hydrocarboniphaga sp. TaxID=2033016 RepID=UPI00262953F2|nr:tyrosine-protein phosphatase [Hydrocarboniphaga sp.]MDB5969962.1 hypothetical protein [Hydrocarboniphaga sp.]